MKFKHYKITWCPTCKRATIVCPKCNNSSCNGGSCRACSLDIDEFNAKNHYRRSDFPDAQKIEDEHKKFWEETFGG